MDYLNFPKLSEYCKVPVPATTLQKLVPSQVPAFSQYIIKYFHENRHIIRNQANCMHGLEGITTNTSNKMLSQYNKNYQPAIIHSLPVFRDGKKGLIKGY